MQQDTASTQNLAQLVNAVDWYHTINLGNGIVTPGMYDHRPHLHHYGLPADLHGKTGPDSRWKTRWPDCERR